MIDVDYSKAGNYNGKEWLKLKSFAEEHKGKVNRFRAANMKEWAESKRDKLYVGNSEVIENDKGIWGSDYSTIDGKHHMTSTFVDAMKELLKPFKIRKRSQINR